MEKERQSDEIGEGDFGELKQDLQAIRFEMLSYLKQTRDDSLRLINHLSGTSLRDDELFKSFKSDPLAHLNIKKSDDTEKCNLKPNDELNLPENDKHKTLKTGANEPSSEVNSSSTSSETGADSNTGSSSVSNSCDSLKSNGTCLSEISLINTAGSILNENQRFNPKNYTTYELDIIKEEIDISNKF